MVLLQINIIWLLTVFLLSQVDGQIVAILVQNMERLDENNKEEADGVHNTLGYSFKFTRCYVGSWEYWQNVHAQMITSIRVYPIFLSQGYWVLYSPPIKGVASQDKCINLELIMLALDSPQKNLTTNNL